MSDVTLLRKLTLKSIMNFGKFFDLTVQQCIDTKKKVYLRWVYFNCSNITFMDEILNEINIPIEYRFDKPNKNVELGINLENIIKESYPEWVKEKIKVKAKRYVNNKEIKNEVCDSRNNTKIKLLNKNRNTINNK